MDASDIKRTLGRMAHQILETNRGAQNIVVVGVLNRGFPVAKRLAFAMTQIEGNTIPCGKLDITPFRDDQKREAIAESQTEIPFDINNKIVILVDEVIQTGRTIRAALDALFQHARPQEVQLAVLIDRNGRQLPIQPNYIGKQLDVENEEFIVVHLDDNSPEEKVTITKGTAS